MRSWCVAQPVSFCQSQARVWQMAGPLDHGASLKEVFACHTVVSGIVVEPDKDCALKKAAYCTQKSERGTLQVAPLQRSHMQNWRLGKVWEAGERRRCSEFELETGKSGAATGNEK